MLSEKEQIARLKKELVEVKAEAKEKITGLENRIVFLVQNIPIALIDKIIGNDTDLYANTGLTKDEFVFLCRKFKKCVKITKDSPLFPGDLIDPGNRCKHSPTHILFFTLSYLKHHPTQDMIASHSVVDQATISRYISFGEFILDKILPTAKSLAEIIANIKTMQEFEKIIPQRRLYIDGTFAKVQRPQENQQEYYSGKRKTHTYNTTIISNKDQLIVDIGKSFAGNAHDFTMLKEDPPEFGRWSDSMKDPKTNPDSKITLLSDLGYKGIEKLFPGANSKQPRKKSKKQSLTMTEKERNARISKDRIKVEHAICRLKQWRIISDVYTGTQEKFDGHLQVVSGLANLHIMHKHKKYRHLLEKIF